MERILNGFGYVSIAARADWVTFAMLALNVARVDTGMAAVLPLQKKPKHESGRAFPRRGSVRR